MALLFDRAGQTTGGVTTGFTVGFKCNGADRLLLVFVCYGGEASARTPSVVAYNSVPMTLVPGSAVHDGVGRGVVIYYMVNPPGGTNNVTITFAATVFQLFGGFINYYGAHQVTPPTNKATNFSTTTSNPTVTLASSAGKTVVAGVMSEENTTMTITAGTSRMATNLGAAYCADVGTLDGGGALSWTTSTPGWAASAVELTPSNYSDSSQGDAVRFYPRGSFPERTRGMVFEGTDGDPVAGTYTTLYTVPATDIDLPVIYNQQTNLSLGTYRYLRARTGAGCYGNVSEVEFYKAGVKVTGTPFGSPGSYGGGGATFDKALDGDTGTFFDAPNPDNQYMGLDKGAAVIGTGGGSLGFRLAFPLLVGLGYIPPVVPGPYTDNFDSYANGALLDAQPGWKTVPGFQSVAVTKPGATGEVGATAGGVDSFNYSTAVYGDAQYSEITIGTTRADNCALVACISIIPGTSTSTVSYYAAYYVEVTSGFKVLTLTKAVSGFTGVNLAQLSSFSLVTGDKLRLTKTGTGSAQRLTVTKNGVNVTGAVNIDPGAGNGGYITGGQAGIYASGVGTMRIASWTSG